MNNTRHPSVNISVVYLSVERILQNPIDPIKDVIYCVGDYAPDEMV